MPNYDEFKGRFPYASELFGVYQPLLGWKSRQATERVDKEIRKCFGQIVNNMLADPRIWEDNKEKPKVKNLDHLGLLPAEWLNTRVSEEVLSDASRILEEKGRPPTAEEWKSIVSEEHLGKAWESSPSSPSGNSLKELGLVFYPKNAMTSAEFKKIGAYPIVDTDWMVAKEDP